MKNIYKFRVKSHMVDRVRAGEFIDCGEVQCTQLAEEAQHAFNDYDNEDFFQWAFEVAQWWEKSFDL